eukprot:2031020-Pleurochrysis_carterae.AAC.1
MFDESIFPEVKRIIDTFVSHSTRYSLPSVAQQADLQCPQRSVVPSPATTSDDTETTSLQPPPTSQLPPTADGTPPPADSSANGPPSRCLCSSGYTPDPRGLLATVLH